MKLSRPTNSDSVPRQEKTIVKLPHHALAPLLLGEHVSHDGRREAHVALADPAHDARDDEEREAVRQGPQHIRQRHAQLEKIWTDSVVSTLNVVLGLFGANG